MKRLYFRICVCLAVLIIISGIAYYKKHSLEEEIKTKGQNIATRLIGIVSNAVFSYDLSTYLNAIEGEMIDNNISTIFVDDFNMANATGKATYYVGISRNSHWEFIDYNHQNTDHAKLILDSFFRIEKPLKKDDIELGRLYIFITDKFIKNELITFIAGELAVFIFFCLVFFVWFRERDNKKLKEQVAITLKLAEEAATARNRTNKILNTIQNGVIIIDAQSHEIIDVNPAGAAMIGTSAENIIGRKCQDFLCPDQKEDCPITDNGNTLTNSESILLKNNQQPLEILKTVVPITLESRECLLETFVDISERKKAEDKLRYLRNYLSNIIDSMPSVLVGVDIRGKVTQWNKTAEQATGIPADDAHGKTLSNVFPRLGEYLEKITESINSREIQQHQKRPCQSETGTIYEDVTIYPLLANGEEEAVIRIDDVTERVRLEEIMVQSEKMLSVGGLAAGMAHEINNPLSGIMQSIQNIMLFISSDLPQNRKNALDCGVELEQINTFFEKTGIHDLLEGIRESTLRAAQIVSDMLNFSRNSELKMAPTDAAKLVRQAVELASTDYDLKKKHDFRHIQIVENFDKDLPRVVCVETEIQQVLLNILRNGAQAMQEYRDKDKNKPKFILRLVKETEANMMRIEVEDNGPGMDEATRKCIFQPFFTTKPVGQGTGLGLSVSYFIITENHGGTMSVTAEPGKGSTFIIRLPLEAQEIAEC